MTATTQRDLLIAACAASSGIHAALTPDHVREHTPAGVAFAASAVVLAGLCLALSRQPQSSLPVTGAAVALAGLLAAYALATTTGVPVLHPSPEPADGLGLATKAIELLGLVAALHLLAAGHPVARLTRLLPKGTAT